jgi:hypothetical protein
VALAVCEAVGDAQKSAKKNAGNGVTRGDGGEREISTLLRVMKQFIRHPPPSTLKQFETEEGEENFAGKGRKGGN